jgi:hypothetical protein
VENIKKWECKQRAASQKRLKDFHAGLTRHCIQASNNHYQLCTTSRLHLIMPQFEHQTAEPQYANYIPGWKMDGKSIALAQVIDQAPALSEFCGLNQH